MRIHRALWFFSVVPLVLIARVGFSQDAFVSAEFAVVIAAKPRVHGSGIKVRQNDKINNLAVLKEPVDYLGFETAEKRKGEIHRDDVQFLVRVKNSQKIPMTLAIWSVEKGDYVTFTAAGAKRWQLELQPKDDLEIRLSKTGTYKINFRTAGRTWAWAKEAFELPWQAGQVVVEPPPPPGA